MLEEKKDKFGVAEETVAMTILRKLSSKISCSDHGFRSRSATDRGFCVLEGNRYMRCVWGVGVCVCARADSRGTKHSPEFGAKCSKITNIPCVQNFLTVSFSGLKIFPTLARNFCVVFLHL